MKESTKKRLHKKWQKRYDKAWRIAYHKACDAYNEDICTCSPSFYFKSELDGLKKLSEEYYTKVYG